MGKRVYSNPGVGTRAGQYNDLTRADIPPGGVSSVFGRAGDVVAANGDYTSSLVTNVTGIVPGASVGNALVNLHQGLRRDPVIDPPSSTLSNDDQEFVANGTGADVFATGLWKIFSDTRPVTTPWIRDGDLDLTVTPAANHFRSGYVRGDAGNVRNQGGVYLQVPAGSFFIACTPFAGAISGKQIWRAAGGMMNADFNTPGNSGVFQLMMFLGIAGPLPDNENRFRVGVAAETIVNATRVGGAVVTNNSHACAQAMYLFDGVGAVVDHSSAAAGNVVPFAFRRAHVGFAPVGQGPQFSAATCWVGVFLGCAGATTFSGGGGSHYHVLNFLRKQPLAAGIIPLAST